MNAVDQPLAHEVRRVAGEGDEAEVPDEDERQHRDHERATPARQLLELRRARRRFPIDLGMVRRAPDSPRLFSHLSLPFGVVDPGSAPRSPGAHLSQPPCPHRAAGKPASATGQLPAIDCIVRAAMDTPDAAPARRSPGSSSSPASGCSRSARRCRCCRATSPGPLGGGDLEVGIVTGAFAITGLACRPLAGRLADRRGRAGGRGRWRALDRDRRRCSTSSRPGSPA